MATSESVKGDARTRNVTDAADPSDAPADSTASGLEWEDVDGRHDPKQRYALYKICPGHERDKVLVFATETEEGIGIGLVLNAREGMFLEDGRPCRIGLLDRQPDCPECERAGCDACDGTGVKPTGTWLVLPWEASPRNVSDAARTLRGARRA